ncbi:MAG: sensor histidine kinase [Salibacteraceae bacterium]
MCVLWFAAFGSTCYCQTVHWHQFKVEDGLLNNLVYGLYTDPSGLLLVSTADGIVLYDGQNFIPFEMPLHNRSKEILAMVTDRKDQMWFIGFSDLPLRFDVENRQIIGPPDLDVPEYWEYETSMFDYYGESIWASFRDLSTKSSTDCWFYNLTDATALYVKNFTNDFRRVIAIYTWEGDHYLILGIAEKEEYGAVKNILHNDSLKPLKMNLQGHFAFCLEKRKTIYTYPKEGGLFQITPDSSTTLVPVPGFEKLENVRGDAHTLIVDNHDRTTLYLSTKEKLVAPPVQSTVSVIETNTNDNETWVGSMGDGIFLLPPIRAYSVRNSSATASEETLRLISTNPSAPFYIQGRRRDKTSLYAVSEDLTTVPEKWFQSRFDPVLGIYSWDQTRLILDKDSAIWYENGKELKRMKMGTIKRITWTSKNTILVAASWGVGEIDLVQRSFQQIYHSRCYVARFHPEYGYWFGTKQGLFQKVNQGAPAVSINLFQDKVSISAMDFTQEGYLLIGTENQGLHLLDPSNGRVERVHHLPKNSGIKKIKVDGEVIWVLTDRGLFCFHQKGWNDLTGLMGFGKNLNIHPAEIKDFQIRGEEVFLDIGKDILRLKKHQVFLQRNPKVQLLDLSIGDSILQNTTHISLSFEEQPVEVRFFSTQSAAFGNTNFWYSMVDAEVKESSEILERGKLVLRSLHEGQYRLLLFKADEFNLPVGIPLELSLDIAPPYYRSTWFRLLTIGAIFSIVGGIFWFYLHQHNLRKRILLEKAQSSLRARSAELLSIRSQINPHFVFNSLNSVQSFVMLGDFEASSRYLSKLSQLIRRSLRYSKKELVPLKDEVDYYKAYLDFENYRMPENILFSLTTTNVPEELLVPSLLSQPLLENSIKYAFDEDHVHPEIKVSYTIEDDLLHIQVADNGLGFDTTKTQSIEADSIGISLVRDRCQHFGPKANFLLKSEPEKGTFCFISLPLNALQNDHYYR